MKKNIIAGIGMILGIGIGATLMKSIIGTPTSEKEDKFRAYYNVLNQWLSVLHEGKSIERYFYDKNYRTIAIYGMGEIGNRLYEELSNSDVQVKYAIDKNADTVFSNLEVKSLNDRLEDVDAVIVAVPHIFEEVKLRLEGKVSCAIISLEDILYEL